jgi:hypothetical protein
VHALCMHCACIVHCGCVTCVRRHGCMYCVRLQACLVKLCLCMAVDARMTVDVRVCPCMCVYVRVCPGNRMSGYVRELWPGMSGYARVVCEWLGVCVCVVCVGVCLDGRVSRCVYVCVWVCVCVGVCPVCVCV